MRAQGGRDHPAVPGTPVQREHGAGAAAPPGLLRPRGNERLIRGRVVALPGLPRRPVTEANSAISCSGSSAVASSSARRPPTLVSWTRSNCASVFSAISLSASRPAPCTTAVIGPKAARARERPRQSSAVADVDCLVAASAPAARSAASVARTSRAARIARACAARRAGRALPATSGRPRPAPASGSLVPQRLEAGGLVAQRRRPQQDESAARAPRQRDHARRGDPPAAGRQDHRVLAEAAADGASPHRAAASRA